MLPSLSVIIPNYNGLNLLMKNLTKVFNALRVYPGDWELVVVDDGSSDQSVRFLRRAPVKLVENARNLGFPASCNRGAEAAEGEVLVFLNNDVEVEDEGLFTALVEKLEEARCFSVAPLSYRSRERREFDGFYFPRMKKGWLSFGGSRRIGEDAEKRLLSRRDTYTFFTPGSCMAVKKRAFKYLGGFDTIYSPFYWEDVDLCYMAWRRGLPSLITPSSWVVHPRKGTIKPNPWVKTIRARNRLVFNTKHAVEKGSLASFFFWTALRCTYKGASFLKAVVMYLGLLKDSLKRREREVKERKLGFREIQKAIEESVYSGIPQDR